MRNYFTILEYLERNRSVVKIKCVPISALRQFFQLHKYNIRCYLVPLSILEKLVNMSHGTFMIWFYEKLSDFWKFKNLLNMILWIPVREVSSITLKSVVFWVCVEFQFWIWSNNKCWGNSWTEDWCSSKINHALWRFNTLL